MHAQDPKKLWHILKDLTNLNYQDNTEPDIINKNTADNFNKYFSTVGYEVQKELNIDIHPPSYTQEGIFEFKPETVERVEYLIKRIKTNVAAGHDQLSARLIKDATPVIKEHLTKLINLSKRTIHLS